MRQLFIKANLLFFAFLFLLTGCLKDEAYEDGMRGIKVDGGVKIIEITGPTDGFVNVDLIGSNADTAVGVVQVRLASAEPAANDIRVTLALDPTLVAAYNVVNSTHYEVPSGNLFTVPTFTVTIPRGAREASLQIVTKPNALFGTEYALGVRLVSVSDPGVRLSSNFNSQVVGLTIRNRYDGAYTMTGTLVDAAVTNITAKSPADVELVTTGMNSVYLRNSGAGNPGWLDLFPILSAGAESGYGAFTPEFVFDSNNNVVEVVNAYGQPASNTRSAAIDPSGVNKWDPVTRTLRVKFFMYQPSVIAGVRTSFNMEFAYEGIR